LFQLQDKVLKDLKMSSDPTVCLQAAGSTGPSANLECRSEMFCFGLAANTGRKKVAKSRHLGTIAQL